MITTKLLAVLAVLTAAAGLSSCESSDSSKSDTAAETTAAITEVQTSSEAEESSEPSVQGTTEELIPPVPAETDDVNAITFDSGDCSFAEVITDDASCAVGELSVAELAGNKMMKFTDDFSVPLKGKVQKIKVNAADLLAPEDLPKVRSIEFDMYADAVTDEYLNEDGELVKVPGTICGGGGASTAKLDSSGKPKWYGFSDFQSGEYNFDYSAPIHVEFKFLLAGSGQCWDESMEDANFLVMRWGSENKSNLYIDNIVFLDENGSSIPLKTTE